MAIEDKVESSVRAGLKRAGLLESEDWLRRFMSDGYSARRMISDAGGEFDPAWPMPAAMLCRAILVEEAVAQSKTIAPKPQMPKPKLNPV